MYALMLFLEILSLISSDKVTSPKIYAASMIVEEALFLFKE